MSSPVSAPRPVIAVVEDDVAVLHSLEFTLESQGYQVRAFGRVQDALASEDIAKADCLVVDYALPDGDGVTLLTDLRRNGLSCPAIVIASTPSHRCRRDAEAAGVPVLEKPLLNETLEAMIRDALKA